MESIFLKLLFDPHKKNPDQKLLIHQHPPLLNQYSVIEERFYRQKSCTSV
jgi:hypothetical protein